MVGCVRTFTRAISIACVLIGMAGAAEGAAVTLTWDPNPEPDVAGYRVSFGTASGQYTTFLDVGDTTTYTITNLPNGQTYYFVLQAYNTWGTSGYSNEVSVTVMSPLAVTNVTANRTSPQPVGTAITFSASATGGTTPYQYKWWIVSGTTQTIGSNWSTSSSFVWTPAVANSNYTIRVWARNASSTADAPDNPTATLDLSFAITASGPTNQQPVVNAGSDQTVTLPDSAMLSATVSDDGLPGGTLTHNWTRISGTGSVIFGAPASSTTSASFSEAGSYVLRLTVSDGALSASDDVAVTVHAPPPPSGSLLGAWSFDEGTGATLGDSSGNGRTGAVTGATWTTGRYGQALSFDGNDVVTLGDLDLTGPFTVMVWMQTRSLHESGCGALVMKPRAYGFEICQERLYASVGTGSTWTERHGEALTSADLNVWKHLALTHDGRFLRYYIDGTFYTWAETTYGTSDNVLLFGGGDTSSGFWNGLIDEVRIYNRALSETEIQTDMNTPVGTVSPGQPPVLANPGSQMNAEGTVVSLPLSASDPDGDQIVYSAAGLPPGLTVNAASGVIAGTLSFTSAGTYAASATATAAGQSDTKSFVWTVTDTNLAPSVSAGADQTITLPGSASLTGTVSDDGLPAGTLTRNWTRASGPGTVTFSAPTSATTTASFSTAGSYVLRLTAFDGALSASDDVTVIVNAAPVSGSGLVAHYRLDDAAGTIAKDATGVYPGTLVNGPRWVTGRYAGATRFDGVNDYISLPHVNAAGAGLTIAMWVHTSSFAPTSQRFLAKATGMSAQENDWMLGLEGRRLRFRLKTNGVTTTLTARDLNLPRNTWYHAAATYDGSRMRVYVNGMEVASQAKTGAVAMNANVPLNLGRSPDGSHYMEGRLDDVRIYNRALTAQEIGLVMSNP
jgi:hypothetical protein